MKIFISWSGPFSRGVALALKDWLPLIFNPINVFVSSEDVRKGKRWPQAIAKELETTNYGIACLTHDNLTAPWLLFETGALSKLPESSVSTLLLGGLAPADIGDSPLSHFQHTAFDKDDFLNLVAAINEVQGEARHSDLNLRRIFDKWWDDLNKQVTDAADSQEKKPAARSEKDMLRELLDVTYSIARNMPSSPEASRYMDVLDYEPLHAPRTADEISPPTMGKASEQPFIPHYAPPPKQEIRKPIHNLKGPPK